MVSFLKAIELAIALLSSIPICCLRFACEPSVFMLCYAMLCAYTFFWIKFQIVHVFFSYKFSLNSYVFFGETVVSVCFFFVSIFFKFHFFVCILCVFHYVCMNVKHVNMSSKHSWFIYEKIHTKKWRYDFFSLSFHFGF